MAENALIINRLNFYTKQRLASHAPNSTDPRKTPYEFSLLPIIFNILQIVAPIKYGFLVKSQMALLKEIDEDGSARRTSYDTPTLGPDDAFRTPRLIPDFGVCKVNPDGSLTGDKLLIIVEVKRGTQTTTDAKEKIKNYMEFALDNGHIKAEDSLYGLGIYGLNDVKLFKHSNKKKSSRRTKLEGNYSLVYDANLKDDQKPDILFAKLLRVFKKFGTENGGLFLPRRIENLRLNPAMYEYVYSYIFLACVSKQLSEDRFLNIRPETVFRPSHRSTPSSGTTTSEVSYDSFGEQVMPRPMVNWTGTKVPDYIICHSENENLDMVLMVVEIKMPDRMQEAIDQLTGYVQVLNSTERKTSNTYYALAIAGLRARCFVLTWSNDTVAQTLPDYYAEWDVGSPNFQHFLHHNLHSLEYRNANRAEFE